MLHNDRKIATIPGRRSIFCAIVHFLNVVRLFSKGMYDEKVDLSEMISEVIGRAKN